MSTASGTAAPAHIVTAFIRDGDRVLLCHRSAQRDRYPDVWGLPGGHVEPGELPGAALARELQEELGIKIAPPAGLPMHEIHADAFHMQIWLIETWMGTPANVAADEHDAIAWFAGDELRELRFTHDARRRVPSASDHGALPQHPRWPVPVRR